MKESIDILNCVHGIGNFHWEDAIFDRTSVTIIQPLHQLDSKFEDSYKPLIYIRDCRFSGIYCRFSGKSV